MIRVLIVEDSWFARRALVRELSRHSDLEVVGTASGVAIAREKIDSLRPDVVLLDLELPRVDGTSLVDDLVREGAVRLVVMSSPTPREAENAVRALARGAIDVVCKPGGASAGRSIGRELIHAVRAAAATRRTTLRRRMGVAVVRAPEPALGVDARDRVIAIGASTGGVPALETLLSTIPVDAPGIVIAQHFPPPLVPALVKHLDALSTVHVRIACDGDGITPGVALVAPAERNLVVRREGQRYAVRFVSPDPHTFERPSVDVLLESVAESAGAKGVGVVLTGIGTDGARGLLAMRRSGARTFAQDEESSVVYGMPGEAVRRGAAEQVVGLRAMSDAILAALRPGAVSGRRAG
jgi:two-component system chemotaxis response regulator CheB